jgi:AcrR family transcriptional regulator
VTQASHSSRDRAARGRVDKFAERRAQLAGSALRTLSELGYARTSLREIAQNSEFSHGVLHYYFRDKVDLITHCVRQYKAECVQRYDDVVVTARTAEGLRTAFAEAMAATLREDAPMHRLWYDLRNQGMFEESFREDVLAIDDSLERMVWRVVSRYASLAGVEPPVSSRLAYAVVDGVFQQALLGWFTGRPDAAEELRSQIATVLRELVPAPE